MHIYIYTYIYIYICIYTFHSIPISWAIMGYPRIHHHTSSYIIIHHCRITAMVGLTNTIIIQSLLVKPMAGSSRKAFNDVWTLNLDSFRWTELLCHGNPPAPRSGHVAFQKAGTCFGGNGDGQDDHPYFFSQASWADDRGRNGTEPTWYESWMSLVSNPEILTYETGCIVQTWGIRYTARRLFG